MNLKIKIKRPARPPMEGYGGISQAFNPIFVDYLNHREGLEEQNFLNSDFFRNACLDFFVKGMKYGKD